MKLFSVSYDGGKDSGVTGYWLIEWKKVVSIVLLKFNPNHRENFHSHAFNAFTWWVKGTAVEELEDGTLLKWTPSLLPKFTPRSNMHKIHVKSTTWAFSVRGPWQDVWREKTPSGTEIRMTHGRKIL